MVVPDFVKTNPSIEDCNKHFNRVVAWVNAEIGHCLKGKPMMEHGEVGDMTFINVLFAATQLQKVFNNFPSFPGASAFLDRLTELGNVTEILMIMSCVRDYSKALKEKKVNKGPELKRLQKKLVRATGISMKKAKHFLTFPHSNTSFMKSVLERINFILEF